MKNLLKLLPNTVLVTLELTAPGIQKKIFRSRITTLVISNKIMENVFKIVKYLEESA